MRRAILIGLAAAALLSASPRVRLGGISAGASYTSGPGWWGPGYWSPAYWSPMWWGPGWGPGWYGPGWYSPAMYGPWFHPGFYDGFQQGPGMGELKLTTASRDAVVLLDGAYAGEAKKLKSMWLQPGVYELEVRDDSGATYNKRIYVLTGKTLQIRAQLAKTEKVK